MSYVNITEGSSESPVRFHPILRKFIPVHITTEIHTVTELPELPGYYGFRLNEVPCLPTDPTTEGGIPTTQFIKVKKVSDSSSLTEVSTIPASNQFYSDHHADPANINRPSRGGLILCNLADNGLSVKVEYWGLGGVLSVNYFAAIMDQDVRTIASPNFVDLNLTGAGISFGGGTKYKMNQDIRTTASPQFANVSANNAPTQDYHLTRKDYVHGIIWPTVKEWFDGFTFGSYGLRLVSEWTRVISAPYKIRSAQIYNTIDVDFPDYVNIRSYEDGYDISLDWRASLIVVTAKLDAGTGTITIRTADSSTDHGGTIVHTADISSSYTTCIALVNSPYVSIKLSKNGTIRNAVAIHLQSSLGG